MFARSRNFRKAFLHPVGIVKFRAGNGCHTDNRVHGRPDIMGHFGEEICLGTVCPIRRFISVQQRFLRLPVLCADICDIFGIIESQNIAADSVLRKQNRMPQNHGLFLRTGGLNFYNQLVLSPFVSFQQMIGIERLYINLPVLRKNALFAPMKEEIIRITRHFKAHPGKHRLHPSVRDLIKLFFYQILRDIDIKYKNGF